MICGTADVPWTATLTTRNSTAGQRRRALVSTSRSAALARPVIRPMRLGQERRPALAPRIEQALGGQQLLQLLKAGEQLAEADLAHLIGA